MLDTVLLSLFSLPCPLAELDGIALFIFRAGLPDRQGEKVIKMNHTSGSSHHSWLPTEGSTSYEDVNRSSPALSSHSF